MAKEKTKLVSLRESQYHKLVEVSQKTGMPLVELTTRIIEEWLAADDCGEAQSLRAALK